MRDHRPVSEQLSEPWPTIADGRNDGLGACAAGDVGWGRIDHEQPAIGVAGDMAFVADDLLAGCFSAAGALIDWLSRHDYNGVRPQAKLTGAPAALAGNVSGRMPGTRCHFPQLTITNERDATSGWAPIRKAPQGGPIWKKNGPGAGRFKLLALLTEL